MSERNYMPVVRASIVLAAAVSRCYLEAAPRRLPHPGAAPATAVPAQGGAQAPNPLAGTEWQLESMLEGDAAVKVIPGSAPSLAFAVDRYAGYGGCDWFVGLHILKAENGLQMEAPQKTQAAAPPKQR